MTWAVTFDFHNTIARCDEWFNLEVYDLIPAYFEQYSADLGITLAPDQVTGGKDHYRKLRQRVMDTGVELDAAAAIVEVLQYLSVDVPETGVDEAVASIFRPTVANAEPLEGVIESVRSLHAAEIPLAVVSSAAYHPFLEWTLEKFGIAGCFREILTSASTGYYKSTTKIYEVALNALDADAEFCIHIGDSERFDVEPASAIGMRTVLIGGENPSPKADLNIRSLVGLHRVLEEEFGLARDI